MKGNLKIHLKPKERIYINGAFLRVDRRVTLELLNDMDFLLESHILPRNEATTPLRQLYYVIQSFIIEPHARDIALQVYQAQHRELLATNKDYDLLEALVEVKEMVESSRTFEALKRIRGLFPLEQGGEMEQKERAVKLAETA
ncbi:MAG: flagellar biosynthesis repressor FlbT [Hyphomicrobiaceae bacterium]